MKINDPNFNQHVSANQPEQTQPTGQIGRFKGGPAMPESSRLQPAPDEQNHDFIARLSARQPQFDSAKNLHNLDSSGIDQLENWLKASPDNINQYVEDQLMDALLKTHFQRP